MQRSSWIIPLGWLFCCWTCSANVIEPRWPKVKKCPKMNKWDHCKSSSMVKWHPGFLIILTFRPFPPLPPLREPPLPSKTCKTKFFVANLFKKNQSQRKSQTSRNFQSHFKYGIDKQPHLKKQNAASCKKKVLLILLVRGSQNLHKINEYIQEILQPCVQRHPDIQLGLGSNVLSFHKNGICLPI